MPQLASTLRMHHARAAQLQPVIAVAEFDLARHASGRSACPIPALGSVKGKKLGRARSSISSISKNALQNSSTVHLRWPRWMPSSTTSASTWWNMGEWVASESTR